MESKKVHFRHCLLFMFNQGKKAVDAFNEIFSVYGSEAPDVRTCQNWFAKFRDGNFELGDSPRSGRPAEVDIDQVEALIEEDPRQSTYELAKKLSCSQSSISSRLSDLGKILKCGKWIPHTLTERNLNQRLTTCISNLAKFHKKDFLWKIVTGDEK